MGDNKNFLLFAVLSLAIMLGYQYFYVGPQMEEAQRQYEEQQANAPHVDTPAAPAGEVTASTPAETAASSAYKDAGSVIIKTPELEGSLALRGARLDNLWLVNHKLSMDDNAPAVRLLKPFGRDDAYYIRFGWLAPQGSPAGFVPDETSAWTADNDTLTPDSPVTLAWDNGAGVRYLMEIAVDERFMFSVRQTVINSSDVLLQLAPYGVINRAGDPKTSGLAILHEGALGVFGGILTEKSYGDLQDETFETKSTGGWIGITDHFWLTAMIPDNQAEITRARMTHKGSEAAGTYGVDFVEAWRAVPAGGSAETTSHVFAGAKIVGDIDRYEAKLEITDFNKAIDWGWLWFFTKPIFIGLHYLFGMTGNFGIAILMMTVVLKVLLFPLANKSYVSMAHMKRAQPKIKAMQDRYKDDKARLQQEMMALYKSEKINPMAGCLPMIPQMFIFFALYKTLTVTIEMRHQPFFGWITDLSAPDHLTPLNLFGLIPWDPPSMIAIGVLPILMGVTMWLQQKLNPQTSMDPAQQKIMNMLPIVFTFIMAGFGSGLVLYWTWNNLLSILQQWVIMRRETARQTAAA